MKTVQGELAAINRMKQEAIKQPWGKCQECGKKLSLSEGDGFLRCKKDLEKMKGMQGSEKSMYLMKHEILDLIGFEGDRGYSNNNGLLERKQLEAVYNWVKKQAK